MYIFDIIAVIIFIIVLRDYGIRLRTLENRLKEKDVVNKVTPIISPVVAPIANQITPSTPVQQTQKPVVSSEESYGRIIGRIGIGAVLVGVAFFLNYAFDNNWVGPA